MTNEQVLNLNPGALVRETINGETYTRKVAAVRARGTCRNPRSGADGHAYAVVACHWPGAPESDPARLVGSVYSDAYVRGTGTRTHDAAGARLYGWDLVSD
jgi:hypothetical protein